MKQMKQSKKDYKELVIPICKTNNYVKKRICKKVYFNITIGDRLLCYNQPLGRQGGRKAKNDDEPKKRNRRKCCL